MEPPAELGTNKVWRLRKAMYGLHAAPAAWQSHFATVLPDLGMERSRSEPNVYCRENLLLMVYVDDVMIIGNRMQAELLLRQIGEKVYSRPLVTCQQLKVETYAF